ncbi:TetR/AcrR family transcriptional regulator [Rhodoferax sp.]|uniref:TetR/AcrR family transcriptional regulator n=1 Tax=Rhodoferax sp. TaxID=50421 RepID=UPI00271A05EF|nr:TetR/AcrR family transcriptional regulator [Rhodoferax sp.]MDO9144342.1 TetR/AcrR family transcriptional regulator [Rhodoferax sp.]MDP3863431.1 TetR/AcrR family transcriptional regulator [Rhodoferax sp.]
MNYFKAMEVQDKPPKQRTVVRQASLVEAALLLAAQHSPADITTADLAHAVGISQGAVFKHFASKEAIWLAVLEWVAETLMNRLHTAAADADRAALPALRAVFLAHVDFVMVHPGVPRLIFQELQNPGDTALKSRVRALMQRYRQLLLAVLQHAKTQQALRPDVDLQAAAVLFVGSVQGLVMQALLADDVHAIAALAPGVFALLQQGLQCPPNDFQGTP